MFKLSLGGDAYLEKMEIRHADELLRVTRPIREDIGRYFAVKESADDWRTWIGEYRDLDAQDAGLACGIWQGGELLGMICILEISRHYLSCSLACWMTPDVRGRGLAGKATQAITTYAFEALALERVVIRVATGNHVSQRIPERLGFRYEGVARSAEVIRDTFLDVAIYAMLAGEWDQACARAARYPVRSAAPADERWMAALERRFEGGPGGETLVVPEQAFLRVSADGWLTALATAVGEEEAVGALFARAEGDARRRGVRLLRATLRGDARALTSLGFFPLGDDVYGKAVGDLG